MREAQGSRPLFRSHASQIEPATASHEYFIKWLRSHEACHKGRSSIPISLQTAPHSLRAAPLSYLKFRPCKPIPKGRDRCISPSSTVRRPRLIRSQDIVVNRQDYDQLRCRHHRCWHHQLFVRLFADHTLSETSKDMSPGTISHRTGSYRRRAAAVSGR